MHKFSNLVKFKNDLAASVEHLQLDSAVNEKIAELIRIKKINLNIDYNIQIDRYIEQFAQLNEANNQIINSIKTDIAAITSDIDNLAKTVFDPSDQQNRFTSARVSQLLELDEERTDYIVSRIGSYSDWLYPSLIIYPREKKWLMSTIVASDPLYLVQHSSMELDNLIDEFSEIYKNRLRCYDNDNFSILPQQQFRFVLLWDFLNYVSVDQFDYYLKEMFNLTRPGGSCMFSYNNCDLEGSAKLAESEGGSYANARIVEHLAEQVGFEITRFEDLPTGDAFITHVSWVELRKPGILSTVKAHQALAKIIEK